MSKKTKTLTIVQVCMMEQKEFFRFGDVIHTTNGPLIFQDNGSKILGVCHLDYVLKAKPIVNKNIIQCPQLDDRLGVYCLIDALPRCSAMPKFDILLTTNEECGMSTAGYFEPPRQYNWIFGLDRMGNDVVTYCYRDSNWHKQLLRYFTLGTGAFSDISEMQHCQCKAFNLGIGYYNQHSYRCYANLSTTKKQLKKLIAFTCEHKDTYYPHYASAKHYIAMHGSWNNDIYEYPSYRFLGMCQICGEDLNEDWRYCPYCGTQV